MDNKERKDQLLQRLLEIDGDGVPESMRLALKDSIAARIKGSVTASAKNEAGSCSCLPLWKRRWLGIT